MVRIRLPDATEATLQSRRWQCNSGRLELLLNAMLAPWQPYPGDEEAELREAKIASRVLGAEIVEHHSEPN